MAARLQATGRYPNAAHMSPLAIVFWTRLEAQEENRRLAVVALGSRLAQADKEAFEKAVAALMGE